MTRRHARCFTAAVTLMGLFALFRIDVLCAADVGYDPPLRPGEDGRDWHGLIWKEWSPGKDKGAVAYFWDKRPIGKGEEGFKAVLAEIAKLPKGARVSVNRVSGEEHLPEAERYPFDLNALKDHMTRHGVIFEWIKV